MLPPLTSTQKQVLDFIREYRGKHGVSPTLQEIGDRFDTHRVTVHSHVTNLIQKGYLIRYSRKASRSLVPAEEAEGDGSSEVPSDAVPPAASIQGAVSSPADVRASAQRLPAESISATLRFPLAGRIAAGQPIEAVYENESLDLADLFPAERQLFVLEVRGDSMIEDQICNGDYVIVEQRPTAQNGEIVVAVLPSEHGGAGEATLKRYYRQGSKVRLQPANSAMEPIEIDLAKAGNTLQIRGVVVGVVRSYR
ncbi:MAG: repressor LexA [Planctomycetes bacterium]|nr:repressor LexA [Planctomycetota bacterium]